MQLFLNGGRKFSEGIVNVGPKDYRLKFLIFFGEDGPAKKLRVSDMLTTLVLLIIVFLLVAPLGLKSPLGLEDSIASMSAGRQGPGRGHFLDWLLGLFLFLFLGWLRFRFGFRLLLLLV